MTIHRKPPTGHVSRAAAFGDQAFTRDTLARTLWGEARSEGREGMMAVASVILNRAAKPGWWGRSVADVCLRPWQFSCWLADDPNRAKLEKVDERDVQFRIALQVADQALGGGLPDYTFGATHYHTVDIAPNWARGHTPCAVIGRHAFYNDIA
ncbi:MAG: cell wall hydrolase [Ferrovibrio sp.]|uniref:cell wall hydrolase n=1 Tax=Ferrovibrio sp. TaxID=1917215 RepID=UPI00391D8A09